MSINNENNNTNYIIEFLLHVVLMPFTTFMEVTTLKNSQLSLKSANMYLNQWHKLSQ